jgi:hypothetical protein
MATLELKEKVIEKIKEANDDAVLEEIYQLLNGSKKSDLYTFTESEWDEIEHSRNQIKIGESILENELNKKVEKWLNQ